MNCFAYTDKGCSALNVSECPGKDCGFFKSPAKAKSDRCKALERIAMLDTAQKRYIADTYYGGRVSALERGVTK